MMEFHYKKIIDIENAKFPKKGKGRVYGSISCSGSRIKAKKPAKQAGPLFRENLLLLRVNPIAELLRKNTTIEA